MHKLYKELAFVCDLGRDAALRQRKTLLLLRERTSSAKLTAELRKAETLVGRIGSSVDLFTEVKRSITEDQVMCTDELKSALDIIARSAEEIEKLKAEVRLLLTGRAD